MAYLDTVEADFRRNQMSIRQGVALLRGRNPDDISDIVVCALAKSESPIEAAFTLAFGAYAFDHPETFSISNTTYETQAAFGPYRVDVLVGDGDFNPILAVELDGHDWHDRTKEQARRDRQRDRALLCSGCPTMRFTGSEIFEDAYRCASVAARYIINRGGR